MATATDTVRDKIKFLIVSELPLIPSEALTSIFDKLDQTEPKVLIDIVDNWATIKLTLLDAIARKEIDYGA